MYLVNSVTSIRSGPGLVQTSPVISIHSAQGPKNAACFSCVMHYSRLFCPVCCAICAVPCAIYTQLDFDETDWCRRYLQSSEALAIMIMVLLTARNHSTRYRYKQIFVFKRHRSSSQLSLLYKSHVETLYRRCTPGIWHSSVNAQK